jgi:predicted TIM-barrel fold metal-dependent hydrolase
MHLWNLSHDYPWLKKESPDVRHMLGDYSALRHNFLLPDYQALSAFHQVEKAVHVQAMGFPDDPVQESAWLQKIVDQSGFPLAIIGYANLVDPEVEAVLEHHAHFPNVRGIRMPLNYHSESWRRMADRDDYMRDPQWRHGYSLLSQFGLLFELQIYSHQLTDAARLAESYPEVTMVVEHLAWPTDLSDEGFQRWHEGVAYLAKYPNVVMKLSGIGVVFGGEGGVRRYLRTAVDRFGPGRCLFGSNCPPDLLWLTFDQLVAEVSAVLLEEEREQVFRTNAERIYRF